jgi:hypothetical protein
MSRLLLPVLALSVAASAAAQAPSVSVEAGGSGAAATLNLEQPLGAGLSARVGAGTLPALGVRLAVPVGLRYGMGVGRATVEVGAGAVVTSLASEYLFTWATHTETPAVQAFPTAEAGVRFGVGARSFVRGGLAALYDGHDPDRRLKVLPSLGAGVRL